MDRRNFLKQCALIASGFSVSKGVALWPNSLFAKQIYLENFSLALITNKHDKAILKVEGLIKNLNLKNKNIKFSEYSMAGNHVGDIVLIRDNNLINFRAAHDDLSQHVLDISRELDLPQSLQNPVFMKFDTESNSLTPNFINVFHKNVLIDQFDINVDRDSHPIKGSKGLVIISIKNKSVRIISSSCKHKTCVKMRSINKPGQNLVCIPNEIRITIAGRSEIGVDGISY